MTPSECAALLRRPLADLPDPLPIVPLQRPFDAKIRPPGSKSLTNRALLLAALARGESTIEHALIDAEDAAVMIEALRALGAGVETAEGGPVRVRGCAGRFKGGCSLNLANAGTATRFLTAAACLADAPVVIDGNARMRERPIGELIDALRVLGARVEELGAPGRVPLRVHPRPDSRGAPVVTFGRTQSSQFISAVLIAAAYMRDGPRIRIEGEPTSPAYIAMTVELMRRLGFRASGALASERGLRLEAPTARVKGDARPAPAFSLTIEPDASGATYFWAAAAITPGARCITPGLGADSLQGDAEFAWLLRAMGAEAEREDAQTIVRGPPRLRAIDTDLTGMPDAAMTLAAAACFAEGVTVIRGLRTLRVKETDRIAALSTELARIGAHVEVLARGDDEAIRITPPPAGAAASSSHVTFDTYADHRMAMSLALIGLRRTGVSIRDPACVAKTYPRFWEDLARLYDPAPPDPGY